MAENLDADGLKTAIEADRALTALQQLALRGTLPIAFSPDDGVQPEGTEIEFTVAGVEGRYLTDLRSDRHRLGALSLADRAGRRRSDRRRASSRFRRAVTPPFGADNLVVLSTDSAADLARETI